jgi:hypothetical protein
MKSTTKASRINAVTQVIQHMNSGMTVVEAYREVGMPRSSFYYLVQNNPEAIAEAQAIIEANNREQLGLILQVKMRYSARSSMLAWQMKPNPRIAWRFSLS